MIRIIRINVSSAIITSTLLGFRMQLTFLSVGAANNSMILFYLPAWASDMLHIRPPVCNRYDCFAERTRKATQVLSMVRLRTTPAIAGSGVPA